ncbi:MAG: oxygen-independent coproporphyrinogen III oxidase [Xanthomonadales bacterium]|nr:oxygen-independent coproporphyrinogen III oxidase [Gammaproteobacteria bacterium]NNE04140.1 oxygen-independent coproporphyrinogen III oxidase [Xanthomonadales bacterium]NNL96027.1 oxygen-independent coproporphyrinogen III oxidase [Xanthomonadales bacterium]
MTQKVQFDQALIERYNLSGPRYTSYPTAVQFHEGFDHVAYERFVAASNAELIPRPLSVYMHLPFCNSLCYYCGCTKKITRHPEHGKAYLRALYREIEMQGALFDPDRQVQQLHLGGGTPTFFDDQQLAGLLEKLAKHFSLINDDSREYAIELDPRTVDTHRLEALQAMGFNRISLGVQDFDPDVQKAVNRIQGVDETLQLIRHAQQRGFDSVSVDLIYGLPLQTPQRFAKTLDLVVSARPNRLAVYNYAHLPHLFRAQRMIREDQVPDPATRLDLLRQTIETLTEAGYVYIGMDHFALPDDELNLAQQQGTLQRNFQGYSTNADCDLVGLGASAIGKIGDCYAQNLKTIPAWQSAVAAGDLPIWRGVTLSTEDRLRRCIIGSIMCQGEVHFPDYEHRFGIDFEQHFAFELNAIEKLSIDGLLELDNEGFVVTPRGRLLLRNVAMVFDEYLGNGTEKPKFSRVI